MVSMINKKKIKKKTDGSTKKNKTDKNKGKH